MSNAHARDRYHRYIACLNKRDWDALPAFVAEAVQYNDIDLGLSAYRDMLIRNCSNIPDLQFSIGELVVEDNMVASRLLFDCTPAGQFMGLPVDGRRVFFTENVFYRLHKSKIVAVWSVIDKASIESQIAPG